MEKFGLKYLGKFCFCCRKFQDRKDEMKLQHDNYYELINLKFLLNEHRRSKIEEKDLENVSSQDPHLSECLHKLKSHMKDKRSELEKSIDKLYQTFEKEMKDFLQKKPAAKAETQEENVEQQPGTSPSRAYLSKKFASAKEGLKSFDLDKIMGEQYQRDER